MSLPQTLDMQIFDSYQKLTLQLPFPPGRTIHNRLETYVVAYPEIHPLGSEIGRMLNSSRIILVHGEIKPVALVGEYFDNIYSPPEEQKRTEKVLFNNAQAIQEILKRHQHYRVISIDPTNTPLEDHTFWRNETKPTLNGIPVAYLNTQLFNFEHPKQSSSDMICLTKI